MSKLLNINDLNRHLVEQKLFDWKSQEYKKYYGKSKLPTEVKSSIQERSKQLIELGIKNKSLRIFGTNLKIQSLGLLVASRNPRMRGQKTLFLYYDSQLARKMPAEMKQMILGLMLQAPRYSEIAFFEDEEFLFKPLLFQTGFKTRYEVTKGNSRIALSRLIKEKNPSLNLQHLNLDIQPIKTKKELEKAMSLQRLVSKLSQNHGYFAHTKKQIQSDKREYSQYLSGKKGLLLGVYHNDKLKGLMVGGLHKGGSSKQKVGGLSFFLHPSIQGKGVVKTGYRILLEFFVKNKAKVFYGGTSQPAVQSLSRLMNRTVESIIYVKM